MPSKVCLVAVALVALGLTPHASLADGCFFPDSATFRRMRERATISEPEQKAVVLYRSGTEDLIISPRFSGPATRFAWVIPVPARPQVRLVKGALFHELALLTYRGRGGDRLGTGGKAPAPARVRVLERKAVGAYDVAVLQAGDAGALLRWLRANGFAMLPAARGPIQQYVREKWTFVAARVRVPRAATGLREGTLAPIRLTFKTRKPVYPMRISAANPSRFMVEVYYIVPVPDPVSNDVRVSHAMAEMPGMDSPMPVPVSAIVDPRKAGMPTLASIVGRPVALMVVRRSYVPRECTRDIAWQVPSWAISEKVGPSRAASAQSAR